MATLRPTSEISNIGWSLTGGSDYSDILSDESDLTFLSSASAIAADAIVKLEPGTDPGVYTGWRVYARGKYVTEAATLNVSLLDGASAIASDGIVLGTSYADQYFELSEAEAESLASYNDFRIEIATTGGGEGGGTTYCAEVWLELPDLVAGGATIELDRLGMIDRILRDQPLQQGVTVTKREHTVTGGQKPEATFVNWWRRPTDPEDAKAAKVCKISGYMFPGHLTVWVDDDEGGGWYGAPFAPDSR